ncbi:MAG: N-acetylmuramoyl-L-alanine amidase, partial [Mucilaginibacter sp.]|nr:N-acetylmuramoyl-L-alanine amidase [Mucilaginibacter sp.]
MKHCRLYFLLLSIVVCAACSPKVVKVDATKPTVPVNPNTAPTNPYAATNSFYMVKADSLLGIAKQELPAMLVDSTGKAIPSDWVASVNFGIRKANYVIIHYTAQDSIPQTLKT